MSRVCPPLFLLAPGCVVLAGLLSGCGPLAVTDVYDLHFMPGPVGRDVDARTLLEQQRVPADRLVNLREAFERAPEGALILTCWKDTDLTNFWGPCSHITRKYKAGQVMETYNYSRPHAGAYPQSVEYKYYAAIVLDAGVTPDMLPRLWDAAHRLDGRMYSLSSEPDALYCSTYQNILQRAVNLPVAVPTHPAWGLAVPADALKVPGVKVLWVGVNDQSPTAYTDGPSN